MVCFFCNQKLIYSFLEKMCNEIYYLSITHVTLDTTFQFTVYSTSQFQSFFFIRLLNFYGFQEHTIKIKFLVVIKFLIQSNFHSS